jgi:hypothetical protein
VAVCEVINGEHVPVRNDIPFYRFRFPVDNDDHPLSSLGGCVLPGGGLLHLSDGGIAQLVKES